MVGRIGNSVFAAEHSSPWRKSRGPRRERRRNPLGSVDLARSLRCSSSEMSRIDSSSRLALAPNRRCAASRDFRHGLLGGASLQACHAGIHAGVRPIKRLWLHSIGTSMKVKKAVITAAAESQRALPLQTLIDRDGQEKTVLAILVEQVLLGRVEEICVVVCPGDEAAYGRAAAKHLGHLRFISQQAGRGYGHAIWCARDFTAGEPF